MYISPRTVIVRNLLVSVANGSITLVILLIAPLGLAAVIINTLLVTAATYVGLFLLSLSRSNCVNDSRK